MPKQVKFVRASDILTDAQVLASIMGKLVEVMVKSPIAAKEHLESESWLREIVSHVLDHVDGLREIMSFGVGTEMSLESKLRLLNGSHEQLCQVVELANACTGDTDTLRVKAAGAYVSAAVTARTILDTPDYRAEWMAEIREYVAAVRKDSDEHCDQALSEEEIARRDGGGFLFL